MRKQELSPSNRINQKAGERQRMRDKRRRRLGKEEEKKMKKKVDLRTVIPIEKEGAVAVLTAVSTTMEKYCNSVDVLLPANNPKQAIRSMIATTDPVDHTSIEFIHAKLGGKPVALIIMHRASPPVPVELKNNASG
ncbi:uncharacterized protein BO72DRAFT_200125 [Aspergillus fijiensis CBS 313.89]|uniref:Uncharacterized protein n=1 Tax=Aspergillus fijiensis CBS 313.89 TaxID=1448319 RepID=A0A8G1RLY3_9EURO|nr:uncharacterized protein BO72DRAFT_200125 [Aspergillus fijiensis CBS 313.89]RAK74558.1 hypothetical protein BO72DRAFT_200125 [Aspergillus fijiensis CBS 313.89]